MTDDGVLVRLGTKPADMRQLKPIKFDLPPELLARSLQPDLRQELMAKLEKFGAWGPPTYHPVRAELIPRIDD